MCWVTNVEEQEAMSKYKVHSSEAKSFALNLAIGWIPSQVGIFSLCFFCRIFLFCYFLIYTRLLQTTALSLPEVLYNKIKKHLKVEFWLPNKLRKHIVTNMAYKTNKIQKTSSKNSRLTFTFFPVFTLMIKSPFRMTPS